MFQMSYVSYILSLNVWQTILIDNHAEYCFGVLCIAKLLVFMSLLHYHFCYFNLLFSNSLGWHNFIWQMWQTWCSRGLYICCKWAMFHQLYDPMLGQEQVWRLLQLHWLLQALAEWRKGCNDFKKDKSGRSFGLSHRYQCYQTFFFIADLFFRKS